MADSYNENKLALRLVKGQLTKGIAKLEDACKKMARVPEELSMVSKARGAASVEALSIVSEKSIEVRKVRAKTMASEVQFDPTEFDKVSDKSKEVLIDQSEKDIEKYEDRTMLCIREHDIEIKKKADELLAASTSPQEVQESGSENISPWTLFKP